MRTLFVLGTVLAIAACGSDPVAVEPDSYSQETLDIVEQEAEAQGAFGYEPMTPAEEFEAELLASFVFMDRETMDEACDMVAVFGPDAYAQELSLHYEPSMTISNLPFSHEGASQALETWCAL